MFPTVLEHHEDLFTQRGDRHSQRTVLRPTAAFLTQPAHTVAGQEQHAEQQDGNAGSFHYHVGQFLVFTEGSFSSFWVETSASSQVLQVPLISANKGFFLCSGPFFELGLTTNGRGLVWLWLSVDQRDRTVFGRVGCTSARLVGCQARVEIIVMTYVVRPV